MNLLNRYFSRLTFEWVEEKQNYAIYVACIYNLLGGDNCRFVILFVPAHLGILRSAKISELPWQNLQTRTCPKTTYKVRQQDWVFPSNLPNVNLVLKERNKLYSIYHSPEDPSFEFEISLIHSTKKKSLYQYPNNIQLHWAIDQWATVFNYIGQVHPMNLVSVPSVITPQNIPESQIIDYPPRSSSFELI
jgi:hypothetical protein